jgi:hypothetical protein
MRVNLRKVAKAILRHSITPFLKTISSTLTTPSSSMIERASTGLSQKPDHVHICHGDIADRLVDMIGCRVAQVGEQKDIPATVIQQPLA